MCDRYPPGVTGNEPYFQDLTEDEEDAQLYKDETISTIRFRKVCRILYVMVANDAGDLLHHDVVYDERSGVALIVVGEPSGHAVPSEGR